MVKYYSPQLKKGVVVVSTLAWLTPNVAAVVAGVAVLVTLVIVLALRSGSYGVRPLTGDPEEPSESADDDIDSWPRGEDL